MSRKTGKLWTSVFPVIIWFSAVGCVCVLFIQQSRSFSVSGLAISRKQAATAIDDGIIRQLSVELFQKVKKGDLLAILELGSPINNDYNRAMMESRKATAMAQLSRIKSELIAATENYQYDLAVRKTDRSMQFRQLLLDVEKARYAVLEINTSLEPDKIMLDGLELERGQLKQLLDKQVVEAYEYQKIDLECQQLAKKIENQKLTLADAQHNFSDADTRLADYKSQNVPDLSLEHLIAPLRQSVEVQEKSLAELFMPSPKMNLTAPFDGVVSELYCTTGQIVTAGQHILTVSQPSAESVIVWLAPTKSDLLKEDQYVEIIRTAAARQIVKSQVVSVGPAIEKMPEQLWKNPNLPEWGRPVVIFIPDQMGLLGNEVVGIRGL